MNTMMMVRNEDIASRLNGFILENLLLGKDIDLAGVPSFLDAGIIDSTGVLELVQFIEEAFEVTVLDTDIVPENLDSIAAAVAFIARKTAATPAAAAP